MWGSGTEREKLLHSILSCAPCAHQLGYPLIVFPQEMGKMCGMGTGAREV